jgi:hypothetical protein
MLPSARDMAFMSRAVCYDQQSSMETSRLQKNMYFIQFSSNPQVVRGEKLRMGEKTGENITL